MSGDHGKLAVELIGTTVVFTFDCCDHYEAIELYDEACASLKKAGQVTLTIEGTTWQGEP